MKPEDIRTVAVVGAGTMGAGIAGELARAGRETRLVDTKDECLRRGDELIRAAQASLAEANLLTRDDADRARDRIAMTTDPSEACKGVDLLIEAVSEDLGLKRKLFAEFDRLCPARALLASNTSGLSITEIADATSRPERVAGMHFWNPPHIIPLVEVTKGDATSDDVAGALMGFCGLLGKRPILVRRSVPGFVGNRLQFAIFREALHILGEGIASAEDIDTAMAAGPGLRWALMGPLRIADLGGLDIFAAISEYLFADLSAADKPPALLAEMVERGKRGAKSGEGFYPYADGETGEIVKGRDRALLRMLKALEAKE